MMATIERASAMPAPNPSVFRGQIPELNIIRAFGLIMVILAHMWPRESTQVWKALQLAWTLMDSFFVLSGFLITGILLDSKSRPDYYRSFYIKRALRILPIYYAVIIALTCGLVLRDGYADMVRDWGSPCWFFVYLGNIPTSLKGAFPMAAKGSFIPLWSLQIEEQFYILFPILVRRVRIETLGRVTLGLACFSPICRLMIFWLDPSNTVVQYVFLPCRMEGLALGAWIAIRFRMGPWHIRKRRLTVMTGAWLAVTYVFATWSGIEHTQPLNRTVGFLLSPIAWAHVVLCLILFSGSKWTACLRVRAVQYFGRIGYSGYLFHWPVARALAALPVALGGGVLASGYPKVVAVLVGTVFCASLSWRYFESPILRLKDRFSPALARLTIDRETATAR